MFATDITQSPFAAIYLHSTKEKRILVLQTGGKITQAPNPENNDSLENTEDSWIRFQKAVFEDYPRLNGTIDFEVMQFDRNGKGKYGIDSSWMKPEGCC